MKPLLLPKLFSFFLLFFIAFLPTLALAQFQTLAGIPGLSDGEPTMGGYVQALFYLAVSIAALLAVVKLVIAGAKYMFSDVANTKQTAIADIRGAILGLLLILATVIILFTINQQIVNTNLVLDDELVRNFAAENLDNRDRAQSAVDELCSNFGSNDSGVRCDRQTCGWIKQTWGREDCQTACNEKENSVYVPDGFSGGLTGGVCYWPDEFLLSFEEDRQRCEGELGGKYVIRGFEGTCIREVTQEEQNILSEEFAYISDDIMASLLNENVIGIDYLVLDESINNSIAEDVDAGITYIAIEPPASFAERERMIVQFEEICGRVAESLGSNTAGVVESGNYVACVDI